MVSQNRDSFLTTKKGYPSGRKIISTIKLLKYIKPDTWFEDKVNRYIKKRSPSMSENQWRNDIMNAQGNAGEQLFHDLVDRRILEPDGQKNNRNRYFDVYKINQKRLSEELYNDDLGRLIIEASEFLVNEALPGKTVGKDF